MSHHSTQYSSESSKGAFPFSHVQGQDSALGVDMQRTPKPNMKKWGWETTEQTSASKQFHHNNRLKIETLNKPEIDDILNAGPPSRRVDFGTVLIQQFNLTKQHLISGCLNTQSPVNSVNIVLVFSLSRIQLTIQKYWFWCKIPMWRMPQKHQTDYFCLFDRQVYLFLLKAQIPKPWCTSLLPLFTLLKITSTKKRKTKQKTKLVPTQHHKVTGKGGYGRSCPKKFTNDWKMQPTDQTTTQPLLVRL